MTTNTITFTFPPIHSFPPFYTLQPNTTTLQSQLTTWSTVIRNYCRHHRLFRLSLSDQLNTPLFFNRTLGKRLKEDDARRVLEFMWEKEASAEPVAATAGGTAVKGKGSKVDVWWIWWRKPEEWAGIIEAWVCYHLYNIRCIFWGLGWTYTCSLYHHGIVSGLNFHYDLRSSTISDTSRKYHIKGAG